MNKYFVIDSSQGITYCYGEYDTREEAVAAALEYMPDCILSTLIVAQQIEIVKLIPPSESHETTPEDSSLL